MQQDHPVLGRTLVATDKGLGSLKASCLSGHYVAMKDMKC